MYVSTAYRDLTLVGIATAFHAQALFRLQTFFPKLQTFKNSKDCFIYRPNFYFALALYLIFLGNPSWKIS